MVLTKELTNAAAFGNNAVIQEWFSTGMRDPDEKNEEGRTLLCSAALRRKIETVRVLLAHGASVDASDNGGWTALHYAANFGFDDAAVLLLDHGAQVDSRTNGGSTPLMLGVMRAGINGKCDLIRLLLHYGADFDARDGDGDNAESLEQLFFNRSKRHTKAAALFADIRLAGGWRGYVRYPRFRLLMLRILAEQGRAETNDPLLVRLFPAGPPASEGTKRPREAYRAQKGGRLPRGIFAHIIGYWRWSLDPRGP